MGASAKLPEDKFDFLGYRFGRRFSPKTGRAYLGTVPSKKRVMRICAAIRTRPTGPSSQAPEKVVQTLNRIMTGWANYFCLSSVRKDYRVIERHPRRRFRQWLCRKHQHKWPAIHRLPDRYIDRQLGLVRLS